MFWIEAEKFTAQEGQEAVLAVREYNDPEAKLVTIHCTFKDGCWRDFDRDGDPTDDEVYPPVFIHPLEPVPQV